MPRGGPTAVNVQPHSGDVANYEGLRGLLNPGDKFLCLHLPHGGHLSQGAKVSLTGQDFQPIYYYLDKNGFLNFKEIEKLARKKSQN